MDRGLLEHLDEPAINLCNSHLSLSKRSLDRLKVVQHFQCRITLRLYLGFPGSELSQSSSTKILTWYLLRTNVLLLDALSMGTMTKFWWRGESSLTTSGSQKMDSYPTGTECSSRWILRFRTSATDLIHLERASTSASSFLAHRLVYSMIIPKFCCHEQETDFLYFGPLFRNLLFVYYVRY